MDVHRGSYIKFYAVHHSLYHDYELGIPNNTQNTNGKPFSHMIKEIYKICEYQMAVTLFSL